MANLYENEMQDEAGAQFGDPRTCKWHPGVRVSSPDGMHDAPCGACEGEDEAGWYE